MRLLPVLLLCLTVTLRAAVPAELAKVLKDFRTDGPRGWSFTQTTTAEGETLVERFDAARADFERWSLVQKDGRAPKPDESQHYHEMLTRRSRGGTAPRITDQLDLRSCETVTETPERATYRFRLKPGEAGDKTAEFLRVTIALHRPTSTIESFAIGSTGEFAPTFGVRIEEMKTTMTYSLPAGDRPSLPQNVTTKLRGRAFWFKSLDADMTVIFSDYANARAK